jgi:transcriptional regulator with XRE-family HTH domain
MIIACSQSSEAIIMAIIPNFRHDNGVSKTISTLLPPTSELLTRFGERLRLARRRRRLSAKQVAERAGMVPMTLRSVERGGAGVTIGAYVAVMQVLGIEKDIEQLAAADPLGRELQDARLRPHKGPASTRPATPSESTQRTPGVSTDEGKRPRTLASASVAQKPGKQVAPGVKRETLATRAPDRPWAEQSGFASSAALARLIEADPPRAKRRR